MTDNMIHKEASIEDAQAIVDFYRQVGNETNFLSFGGEEYVTSAEEQAKGIEAIAKDDASIMLLILVDGEIACIGSLSSSHKKRLHHVGTLGIVVGEKYWGQGIGKEMMFALIHFACSNGITSKVSLVVRQDNKKAVSLYHNLGFKVEGVHEEDTYIDGEYYTTLSMAYFV